MTLLVFHGDNTALSRSLLQKALELDRSAGREIRQLDGTKLLAKDLSSILSTSSLFSQESLVIENLLSRLRSKEKDLCLSLIASYSGPKNLILWDKKGITKAVLAKLGKDAKLSESKSPQLLFTFLETIVPGGAKRALTLLHELALSTEDILIFTMLSRHVGNLILADSGSNLKFAPWQIGKLKSQAKTWTEAQLTAFHDTLISIDQQIKTGATKLSYLDHLDILLVNLLG